MKSDFKGVTYNRVNKKWRASVTDSNVLYECGFSDTERGAVKLRDMKIIALKLNKPLQLLKKVQNEQ